MNLKSNTLTTGLAMFSMLFGAGNVVFPLALGQYSQDQNIYAIMGMLITAVAVPFLGLLSMTLFDGNYQHFFDRIGKWPGFIVTLFLMGLIGPFGAMPRTITLSYSTVTLFFPGIPLLLFSLAACVIIFILTYKRSRILDILGYFLTPILLVSLLIIIIKGLLTSSAAEPSDLNHVSVFMHGVREGFNTMDLMGAMFFSSIVILCLKQELHPSDYQDYRKLVVMTLKASCIGASLLGIIYVGFSFVASYNSLDLASVSSDLMLGYLALQVLGPYAGILACVAVALACLTTAMALAAVFAEFLHEDIFRMKVNYTVCLVLTLITTFLISTLNFTGIMAILAPILFMCYPALIVLCICNMLYKLYDFPWIKAPVAITFAGTLLTYFV